MRRLSRTLGLLLTAAVALAVPVLAQEEPAGDAQDGGTRRIAPNSCYVEPMPVEDLISLLGLEGGGIEPLPSMTVTSPLGAPVDDVTTGRITSAVRGLIACVNAGDVLRVATWMTSHGVQRVYGSFAKDASTRLASQALLTTPPEARTPEKWLRLIAISNVSSLSDGRVAAFTVFNDPALPPGGPETALVVFSSRAGGWLLDDWVDFSIVPNPVGSQ